MLGSSANLLFVLSSPSGAGKTTLCRQLVQGDDMLKLSVSATTRPIRRGEVEGKDYIFMDQEIFAKDISEGFFLEHAEILGNLYGTPKKPVMQFLDEGLDVLFDVNTEGAQSIAKTWPGRVVRVFILPPSMEVLEERLLARGTDAPDVIEKRLVQAEEEVEKWLGYDYVVVNDDLSAAMEDLQAIVQAERLKTERFHAYT